MRLKIETLKTYLLGEVINMEKMKTEGSKNQRVIDFCNGAIHALKSVLTVVERLG